MNVVNGSYPVGVHGPSISSASVLVLDDSCVAERDMSNHVMGNIKDVSSISNLRALVMEEGFFVVNLVYLGGLWVMIECDNVETKANMLQHTGVKSWFHVLQNAVHDFVSDERIVWVDIEGIPLNVWSRETFTRIGKKWGEALDIEDNVDSSFGRKRLCIKTKLPLSILESFKVIFKGKVCMVRAKELFTWSPIFLGQKEMEYTSDEDSDVGPQKVPDLIQDASLDLVSDERIVWMDIEGILLRAWSREMFKKIGKKWGETLDLEDNEKDYASEEESDFVPNNNDPNNHINEEEFGDVYGSDDDGMPETVFGSDTSSPNQVDGGKENSKSKDTFEGVVHHEMLGTVNGEADNNGGKVNPVPVSARVMNTSQDIPEEMHSDSVGSKIVHNGGSMLGVMEDFIRIGQAMRYAMEGSMNDLATIIGCTAKDLCKVCNDYGTVVDVFILNKKSKLGKRFSFVRFIKVINLDRLIENINTIWIGQFHLFTNLVRFERPKKPNLSPHNNAAAASSYPRGVDQAKVLVLDDSCVAERDMSNHVMGNIKDVSSISNLRTLIMEEGFSIVNLVYLEGLWVMIECDNVETKANMLQHTGVKSWIHVLQNAVHDFVSDKRIVWVDIEGIPLNVWSRETFTRIGKKWGEALDIKDNVDFSFGRKRLCFKTKLPLSILESFKEMEYTSDEDSDVGPQKVPDRSQFCEEGPNDDREIPVVVNAKVMNNSQDVYKEASCDNLDPNVVKKGGSVLGVMEDMIRVGKAMVGNSCGILCVWEATVFKKDYATILDNFVAIYGTWLPSNSKVLFVAIYAPQQVSRKRLLWDYVLTLIDRWNREVVVLGDFNDVRNIDERRGSGFNPTSARVFDQFISALGLVDVKMEGYTFTWSHPSGSKMSKLDRFLVSE
nr:RNA-directed DNA polymerase, eukaryota [Tanacetum cinerariifolium]